MQDFVRQLVFKLMRGVGFLAPWRVKRHRKVDYVPQGGTPSSKGERLVAYCLGDFSNRPPIRCTRSRRYLRRRLILMIQADGDTITTYSKPGPSASDQKKVVKALTSQRAEIPSRLIAWLIRGDDAGHNSDPRQGLHLSGMRPAKRRDLVLVPTACRKRYLGPNLARQLSELQNYWVPWDEKSDTAWWGGALTGDRWRQREPHTLTRREVLEHFRDQPSDRVSLHLTVVPENVRPLPGCRIEERFSKQSAFSHKCLLLLPGNDIASGSSWYFAGNSVVLMPKPHLEHILYFEMEPWEHYVPLENDPADVLTKLQWVLDNETEAQQIVANSHARLRWLCGPEYLWACNEVLRRVAEPGPEQKTARVK